MRTVFVDPERCFGRLQRELRAAQAIVDRVRRSEARTALIVGAGFIGMEIALLLADSASR